MMSKTLNWGGGGGGGGGGVEVICIHVTSMDSLGIQAQHDMAAAILQVLSSAPDLLNMSIVQQNSPHG